MPQVPRTRAAYQRIAEVYDPADWRGETFDVDSALRRYAEVFTDQLPDADAAVFMMRGRDPTASPDSPLVPWVNRWLARKSLTRAVQARRVAAAMAEGARIYLAQGITHVYGFADGEGLLARAFADPAVRAGVVEQIDFMRWGGPDGQYRVVLADFVAYMDARS